MACSQKFCETHCILSGNVTIGQYLLAVPSLGFWLMA